MISLVGLLIMVAVLTALNVPRLRHVEVDLPDHDPAVEAAPVTQPAE